MNPHTLRVLEFDKILNRLAGHCAFSGGSDRAFALLPSDDLETVRLSLAQTDEAFRLLEQKHDINFGGVRDLSMQLSKAERGALVLAPEFLEVKNTLLRARSLRTLLTRLESNFPLLAALAYNIQPCDHVIAEISRCINERGEVVDGASDELRRIRGELHVAQERLLGILERLVQGGDVKPYLQDALVTQRQGRYVIPVRAEHKGNIEGIVHDQSSSGATLFVEPLRVVQQNNAVRELELQEEKEVRRILTELTELLADEAVYVRQNNEILADLDFIFAKAKYAYTLDAVAPDVVPFHKSHEIELKETTDQDIAPEGATAENGQVDSAQIAVGQSPATHPGAVIDFHRARHPLLDQKQVVPVDVYLDDETFMIIITGPNTGGKTVTLKTVGLLILMAQAGLMIPVEPNSVLSVFEGVYADIGDEQSIEQNLSTFSSHMTNIIAILEEADPNSLVLFDELGAGTDPDEGSALAMALLDNLRDRSITTFATTHYSDLKLYAHNTPGVRNASVEFDVETLRPTYELSIGLPGRSNALIIASRLGLNPVIVEHAESIVRPDTLEADSLLDEIRRARREAMQSEERAKSRERQAQVLERDLRYQLANIEEARRAVIAETRQRMDAELAEVRKEIEQARRQLARGGTVTGSAHDEFLSRAANELSRRQQSDEEIRRDVVIPGQSDERIAGPIEVGDRVWVANLQASGEVLDINERSEEADVQLGNFRLKLPLKRLELRQKKVKEESNASGVNIQAQGMQESPGIELDLRGERVEEGLERMEQYLNNAYMARLPWVRIIHGKGTGAMRDAVRNNLRNHPLIRESRSGDQGEGGDGVTVAKLVSA
ncbi:MAG: Smr/MutS family protein [Caldilineaceae bacterium]|nr:Smr/MutS family protein [Caldilineaceae bacterium]